MKNLGTVEKNWGNPFEEGGKRNGQNAYREELRPYPQAANQSPFLSVQTLSPSSVSDGPPPSFLTRTPLGTPYEETLEVKPRAEMPATRQQKDTVDAPPLSQKPFEQKKQIPNKTQKKTGHFPEIAKRCDGDRRNKFIHRWIYGEVRLSMSKMSIMSLVLGLLFLGGLFFIIGFLAAVSTLGPKEGGHYSQPMWQASDTHEGKSQGHGGGKWGRIASAVTDNLIGQTVRQQLAPLAKGASAAVPRPLQPFARYGIGSTYVRARDVGRQVNPFSSYNRGMPPEQQPYDAASQQPPPSYAAAPTQPYGMAPGEYQQPFSQGGYPMQPIQPMQPQPMGAPQQMQPMAPQQPMMMQPPQYPAYPQQQMAPQQGWYR